MTTKQEAKKIVKERAKSIVAERIVAETLDMVAEWTGEVMGKMTTIDTEKVNKKTVAEAHKIIQDELIDETIKQLVEFKNNNAKK